MEIKRSGSLPFGKGLAEYFTGSVRIDPLFQAPEPARVVGASVTFEPGARTAWHTHPLGNIHCHIWPGTGAALGRPHRGDSAKRPDLVPAWREALARRDANNGHDAYSHSGGTRRQDRRGWRRSATNNTVERAPKNLTSLQAHFLQMLTRLADQTTDPFASLWQTWWPTVALILSLIVFGVTCALTALNLAIVNATATPRRPRPSRSKVRISGALQFRADSR